MLVSVLKRSQLIFSLCIHIVQSFFPPLQIYNFIRQYSRVKNFVLISTGEAQNLNEELTPKSWKRKHAYPTLHISVLFFIIYSKMYYIELSQRLYLVLKVLAANAGCWFQIEEWLELKDGNWDLEPNWVQGTLCGSKKKNIRTPPPCPPKYTNIFIKIYFYVCFGAFFSKSFETHF